MTIYDAINWYTEEIRMLKLAPKINGGEMTKEWQEQIEIHTMALNALREQEGRKQGEN